MKRVVGWLGGVLLLGVFVALGFGYHPAPAVPPVAVLSSPVAVSPAPVAVAPAPVAVSPLGVPTTVITIPRFGRSYEREIVEGTDPAQLGDTNGPISQQHLGHYLGSAAVGQPGNFAIVGHRNPGVMGDLDKLVIGDEVRLVSPTGVYVYKVTAPALTLPYGTTEEQAKADEILNPVPGSSASVGIAEPTEKYMTITSCGKYGESPRRLAVVLKLASVEKS
jgi:sortase A